jgi:hypothetical protein
MDMPDAFSDAHQIAVSISLLPEQGLVIVGRAIASALEGAGERRQEYWTNKVRTFLENFWPKDRNRQTQRTAEQLALASVQTGGAFPEALKILQRWLVPLGQPDYIMHRLQESGLCGRFPKEVLSFLDLIVPAHPEFLTDYAQKCLNAIAESNPKLKTTVAYKRLDTIFRQHELR